VPCDGSAGHVLADTVLFITFHDAAAAAPPAVSAALINRSRSFIELLLGAVRTPRTRACTDRLAAVIDVMLPSSPGSTCTSRICATAYKHSSSGHPRRKMCGLARFGSFESFYSIGYVRRPNRAFERF